MSGTKSPYSGHEESVESTMDSSVDRTISQPCAAKVNYKNVQGSCRRSGKYPDPDGVRWWCGLHRPKTKAESEEEDTKVEVIRTSASVSTKPKSQPKPKATLQPAYEGSGRVVDVGVLASVNQAQVADEKALVALREAQSALIEIANTNTVGWDATVPVDRYKVLIDHMSGRAREASVKVTEAIRDLDA